MTPDNSFSKEAEFQVEEVVAFSISGVPGGPRLLAVVPMLKYYLELPNMKVAVGLVDP